jgi:RHS repeat-associated protein
LSNILSIVENQDSQDKTITTDIPADSNYSKLNQYARFDQWGLTYDLNGNLTQKGTQNYVHDYRNRIVRATDGSSTVNFKYDPLGRRIKKEVTIGSQIKTTNFYYSGHQLIEERDGSNQVTRQLIYGNGIDEVIRVDKYNGPASTPYYFHSNGIGSTTAITDANGNIVERVDYDIYGLPTFKDAAGNVITKSSIGNNILFQGREYDPELNLYYFRARYYCPIMGRFLQTDPMGYADSMNLYQGFNMNPGNFVDPYGLAIINVFKGFTKDPKITDVVIYDNKSKKDIVLYENRPPDWENLKILAVSRGHTLNYFDITDPLFTLKNIADSFNIYSKKVNDEVWTFFIGHSAHPIFDPVYRGFDVKNVGFFPYSTPIKEYNPWPTTNRYIGLFTCDSMSYVDDLFSGKNTTAFYMNSGEDYNTSLFNLEAAAYAVIKALIMGLSPDIASQLGTEAIRLPYDVGFENFANFDDFNWKEHDLSDYNDDVRSKRLKQK